jgi:hypothetical protein
MRARCQISTKAKSALRFSPARSAQEREMTVRFLTDSKTLSLTPRSYAMLRDLLIPAPSTIGLERAITDVPGKFKMLDPMTVRREFR